MNFLASLARPRDQGRKTHLKQQTPLTHGEVIRITVQGKMVAPQLSIPVLETGHKSSLTWDSWTAIEKVFQVNAELELGSPKNNILFGDTAEGPESGSMFTNCPWFIPNMGLQHMDGLSMVVLRRAWD